MYPFRNIKKCSVLLLSRSQTVKQHSVDVKHIEGDIAVVEGPISLGQKVVAAGAAQMRENMKVLPYKGEK